MKRKNQVKQISNEESSSFLGYLEGFILSLENYADRRKHPKSSEAAIIYDSGYRHLCSVYLLVNFVNFIYACQKIKQFLETLFSFLKYSNFSVY